MDIMNVEGNEHEQSPYASGRWSSSSEEPVETPERPSRTRSIVVLAAAGALMVAGATWALWPQGDEPAEQVASILPTDEPVEVVADDGTVVTVDAEIDDAPDEEEVRQQDVETLEGDLVIESVGMATPLREMSVVDNVINPPTMADAYVVRDYAEPGDAEHMAVIAMHSRFGGEAPGNALIDIDTGQSTVSEGEAITVLGHDYEVVHSFTPEKLAAANSDELWADEPGKLLIFTCLQQPTGAASVKNAVIEARLVSE